MIFNLYLVHSYRSQSTNDRQIPSTVRSIISASTTTRAMSVSDRVSSLSHDALSVDCHETYNRILPFVRYQKLDL